MTTTISRLVDFFVERFASKLGVDAPRIAPDAIETLTRHRWLGNVRELQHCIERMLVATSGYAVQVDDVDLALGDPPDSPSRELDTSSDDLHRQIVRRFLELNQESPHERFMDLTDKLLVSEALRVKGGNQSQAARLLGIARQTLQAKMEKHGLRRRDFMEDA